MEDFSRGKLKEYDHLDNLGRDWCNIYMGLQKEDGRAWNIVIWLRIGLL